MVDFHFTAEQNGNKTMDGDFEFNLRRITISSEVYGSKITDIVNTFQMGAMPFGIVSSFNSAATGISSSVKNDVQKKNDGKMYNLNGQVVSGSYKGVSS